MTEPINQTELNFQETPEVEESVEQTVSEVEQLQAELDSERRRANGILNDLRGTRSELTDLRGKFDVLADNFTSWQQSQQREEEPLPDDPFERIEVSNLRAQEEARREIAEIRNSIAQYAQTQAQQAQLNQVANQVVAQENEFRKEHEDYDDAFNYIKDLSTKYLVSQGLDNHQVQAALQNEQIKLVIGALQQGRNPAEVIYQMSKNMGYQGTSQETGLTAPAVPVANKPTSLSSVPSKGQRARFNLQALAQEDPEEFNKIATDPDKWKAHWIAMGHPE